MRSTPTLPPLPIDACLTPLVEALAAGHAVLTAPPGSGKTTKVPLVLLEADWLAGRTILLLEPRRPATRMAAARMADLLGEAVGDSIGYQIRFERRVGPRTRIQVLTEGVLIRRIQEDPALDDVGLVIFDEFHERTLAADLALALTLDTWSALRPDLRLLIMSATLDAQAMARRLGAAPVIEGQGRSYPVAIHYRGRSRVRDLAATVVACIRRALDEQSGDLLVFLPGVGEIERVRAALSPGLGPNLELLPLHGNLSGSDQDRALRPGPSGRRRILLATDIAETSVTIDGVTTVIDSGLTRKPRFDPGSGLTRLVTEPISLASATQRAGRAGRQGPGTCYRLWSQDQEIGRPAQRPAEILQADLAPLALELALWGEQDPARLSWLDPPPGAAWHQAIALLRDLEALTPEGRLTPLGRRLANWPVHPRLARLLAAAPSPAARDLAADLAALLSDRDPFIATPDQMTSADLGLRLQALDDQRAGRPTPGLDRHRLRAAARLSAALRRSTRVSVDSETPAPTWLQEPGALLALAYPDRVAQRRGSDEHRYRLAAGPGVQLARSDPLTRARYLVVAELDAAGQDGRIRLALPISEEALREVLAARITTREQLEWDPAREAVAARRETRLGELVLAAQPLPVPDDDRVRALLVEQAATRFDQAFDWNDPARQLQARVALMRRLEPESGWPDLSDEALLATLPDWLGPWLPGLTRLADLRALRLAELLEARLDWPLRQRLADEAPTSFTMPTGHRRRLDYASGPVPTLAVPLQELFGARQTPTIARGRLPIRLQLLSPARRPVQVTQDLAGFWARAYPEVRKELRGRYPKHHWPEDPLTAEPVAGVIRRRR
ncbi:ATP-dependent helicase HrpB [Thioalkalicoccus limnaeus]|uniref:ATP-dependent helicase HrpB n=1 Tax=Thioalkalicoccus limnaeus TaxID=120681 RepID=A0ABV4BH72_9GAMM